METITKFFRDYPFAHRQPKHSGHCRFIHGHNWTFEVSFTCQKVDQCGFILDFGKDMKEIKEWLTHMFDHTLVLAEHDHIRNEFSVLESGPQHYADIRYVGDPSCEGLSRFVYRGIQKILNNNPECVNRGVKVIKVTVHEDPDNSATYFAPL